MTLKITAIALASSLLFACSDAPKSTENTEKTAAAPAITNISFALKNTFPHDVNAFTEGFLVHDGQLYESTGATQELPQTKSLFGTVDLKTGKISTKAELNRDKYFGEGIVFLNGKVYQLTYQTKIGFIYDAKTFKKTGEFTFPSAEGWGMTTDGTSLIMSDGTNTITYLDAKTFKTVKTLAVAENGYAKDNLNELEIINGYLYANVWTKDEIVKIDLTSGAVVGKLDLRPLAQEARLRNPGSLEMNGIAYDAATGKVYITGKMWPSIYEIAFTH